MQFQVPQFIEVENKIIGPLTLKQFIYLAAAGILSFIFYFIFEIWLWFMLTAFFGAIAVSLAFIKYNGQPLPQIAFAAFSFFWKPRFFLWQRSEGEKSASIEMERKTLESFFKEVSSVKKLWQNLMTTKNPIPKREKRLRDSLWGEGEKGKERFQLFRKVTGEREIARRVDYR